MGQYTSYYLYQKFEKRDGQDFIPVYPNTYSVDADGTMPRVVKNENDENCGYIPPAPTEIYRWVQITPTSDPSTYVCDDCPIEPIYRWVQMTPTSDPSTYVCDDCPIEPIYRWENSGTTCVGYDKYQRVIKQVSYDNGSTWENVSPAEYSATTLIEANSEDCGYVPPTPTDYSNQYLTFVAIDSSTFSFRGTSSSTINNSSIQYSTDSGSTWNTLNRGVQSPTISAGQKIMWKSSTLQPINDDTVYVYGIGIFSSTGRFNTEGNSMSLFYGNNFQNKTSLSGKDMAFKFLFSGCTGLISAENLVLPATTLANECYANMFYGCSGLTTAPALSATTLVNVCYGSMFMDCTSLTTAPDLPATTLADSCYQNMFRNCDSLTTAPELPATTLADGCYKNMFRTCDSLTTAPELPATTLADSCYQNMFRYCSRLIYVKCLATDISASDCTTMWLDEVPPSSGTFVKDSNTTWPSGESGIPSGWTVQNA